MDRVTISVEVINKAMAILGKLPYDQVANIVEEIRRDVKPIEGAPTKPAARKPKGAKA